MATARRDWAIVLFYLLTALPIVLFLALVVPPMQVPDEDAHFLRAVQIGQGGLLARGDPPEINGLLPAGAERFARGPGRMPNAGHGVLVERNAGDGVLVERNAGDGVLVERNAGDGVLVARNAGPARDGDGSQRAWRAHVGQLAQIGWVGPRRPVFFGNTAIYPPVFYAPAALAIDLVRASGGGTATALLAARLAQAAASLLLAVFALRIAMRGRLVLFILLSLPMMLFMFGSSSQDGPMLAVAAVAAAWLSRRDRDRPGTLAGWIAVGLLIGLLGAAKLPSIVLAALPVLVGSAARRPFAGIASGAVAVLLSLGWFVGGALPLMASLARPGVSAAAQLRLIVAHPLHAAAVLVNTVHVYGPTFVRETIGVLGLLDTELPGVLYAGVILLILVAVGIECVQAPRAERRLLVSAGIAIVLGGCAILILVALYLAWTPVGANLIEGVQGRYLLPPLVFGILLLPRSPLVAVGLGDGRMQLAAVMATFNVCFVPAIVIARYSV